MLGRAATVSLLALSVGCSLPRTGLGSRPGSDGSLMDGGEPGLDAGFDAPPFDSAGLDASEDADRTDAAMDVGAVDTGGSDTGPSDAGCEAGTSRCAAGDVLETCVAGSYTRMDCAAAGAYCQPAPDGRTASCMPRICVPGTRRCAPDGSAVWECDEAGRAEMPVEACSMGCDTGAAACVTIGVCPLTGVTMLSDGAVETFSLCGRSDDFTHTPTSSGCPTTSRANAGDRIFRFTLASTRTVRVDLRDWDRDNSIDTIVYIRRVCDDGTSQVACSDDIPCSESDFTCTGTVRRQSIITTTLDVGTYYVVADAFIWDPSGPTRYRCGQVQLKYDLM